MGFANVGTAVSNAMGSIFEEGRGKVVHRREQTLSNLVREIKSNMTLSEFSSKTSIGISTLSRILNDKIFTPLAADVIKKIAQLIPEGSSITIEQLEKANNELIELSSRQIQRNIEKATRISDLMKNVAIKEMEKLNSEAWWRNN